MRTPSLCSVKSRNSAMSCFLSRSLNKSLMRSSSSSSASLSRRFARPLTINLSCVSPLASQKTTPFSTSSAAKLSNSCLLIEISCLIISLACDKVRPCIIEFKKFAASFSELGVWPNGGLKSLFSTWPLEKTKTTSARSCASDTNSMCSISDSCFGLKTREAP